MSIINVPGIRAAWDNLMFQLDLAKLRLDENGTASLQGIIFGVVGAVVALIVAVIVLGNLDTATQGTMTRAPTSRSSRPSIRMVGPRSPCSRSV